ncbi:MAG: hypothetical protein CVU18_05810 [Betaproteobacteria bacterium HGW-Betaproteobacteria-12]|nr:MAG: hypothetical protein CVU18_05810 [Betaproteobacteria bacterium HGW-Betaproteobacteria-12]
MKNGQSLYLDLIRFLMAFEVMIGHATFHGYTGRGFLWQLDPFRHLQTAVMGFFVLSGFVIAYIADTRERDGISYASARIARMHSVIIPALLVTLLFDWLGLSINPDFYQTWDFPTPIGDDQGWRYLLSFLYLNNTWIFPNMNPGTNGPFWTMTYEVMYYVMFGLALYIKGKKKYALLIFVAAIAGPAILTYSGIWLLGAGAYYLQKRKVLAPLISAILFMASLLLILTLSAYGPTIKANLDGQTAPFYYAIGILFALNIYSSAGIDAYLFRLFGGAHKRIRQLGMLTFALYLCHRPLLNFFSVFKVDEPSTIIQKLWLFSGTIAIVVAVAHCGEWMRVWIFNGVSAVLRRLSRTDQPKPQT